MSLYYSDDLVELHLGDCRAIRGWTTADVLVTDPPYGTGQNGYGRYGKVDTFIANDDDTTCRDEALVIWGDRPAAVFAAPRKSSPPGAWDDSLVWDKGQLGLNGGPWRYQHEAIYVRGFERRSDGDSSIIRSIDQRSSSAFRPHPHFKPVGLMEHLIERAPAGIIADPFAGSGSTLIAARNLGKRVIGVELEEKYCDLIVRRLSQQAFIFEDA